MSDRVIQLRGRGMRGAFGIDLDGTVTPGQVLQKGPGPGRNFVGVALGGADSALRGDLAGANGSALVGYTPAGGSFTRAIRAKLNDAISVLDFGATGLGTSAHDDYQAFVKAFNACPNGGTILIPIPTVAYYLSANPDDYQQATYGGIVHNFKNKYVNWAMDSGVIFAGPGAGLPTVKAGNTVAGPLFASQITNPYNQTFGSYRQIDMRNNVTLNGGCLIGESVELVEDFGYGITITGDLTNGSSDITNVNVTGGGAFGQIKTGDRLVSTLPGWPSFPFNLVWSVAGGNKITFGIDAGAGPSGPGPTWTGASQTGVSFTVLKKAWYAGGYLGYSTGGPNSVAMAYGGFNAVANITGAPTNIVEYDLIALSNGGGAASRGIFMTGHGDAGGCIMYGLDMQRAGRAPWTVGVGIRDADTGIYLNASKPIAIDTSYYNPITGAPEPIQYGIHFNNSPGVLGSLFEGRQITDGAPGIALWRNTDTNPTGDFFRGYEAFTGKKIAFIDVLGGGHFTSLQLNQVPIAHADAAITGYVTIIGADGNNYKVATIT